MFFCGRSKSVVLVYAGFAALFFIKATLAQEASIPSAGDLKAEDCTPELFASVDHDYRIRPFRESDYRAERYIREILEVCPSGNSDGVLQAELQTLEEERAEHSFLIANYYLDQAQKGKGGLMGARARFLEILEKYPNYSKIDEVLLLLCRTCELESDSEHYPGGQKRLQLLLKQFPLSPSRATIETVIQELETRETIERIKEGT